MQLLLVEHTCTRAAAELHQQLAQGTALLATISATAPLAGFLGTAIGIVGAFRGPAGPPENIWRAMASEFSVALFPSAFGLATAIFAWCLRAHCRNVIAELNVETRAVTLTFLNELRRTAP